MQILANASLEDVKALHSFCVMLPPFEQVGFHLHVQLILPAQSIETSLQQGCLFINIVSTYNILF